MNSIKTIINNVNDFIIYSFLNIEINRKISKTIWKWIRWLRINKIIIIINEINIINTTLLIKINNNCVIIKTWKRDINNFWKSIFIVILMKNFFYLFRWMKNYYNNNTKFYKKTKSWLFIIKKVWKRYNFE